jgi:type I restriction-modification system DNA methylase subunit
MDVREKKQNGVYYTPEKLSKIMAGYLFDVLDKTQESLTIVDPACGDGSLLEATAEVAREHNVIVKLIGFDTDKYALQVATQRLTSQSVDFQPIQADFLKFVTTNRNSCQNIDGVIANPPYVRTQQMGSEVSRVIAQDFGLTGKIDLYQAFYAAISLILKNHGAISAITSNKFATNKTGSNLRNLLVHSFEIKEFIDLGDTKLFDAAVLPAIVIGKKNTANSQESFPYYKIYEETHLEKNCPVEEIDDVYKAIDEQKTGHLQVNDTIYSASEGRVNISDDSREPWVLASEADHRWASNLLQAFGSTISDFATVRVGIKTTADKVFIRDSWNDIRPSIESSLIHPLYSAKTSKKWKIGPSDIKEMKEILYPMQAGHGKRKAEPIDLSEFPKAEAYLKQHFKELSSRKYIAAAGRQWFEIWVPQDPKLWTLPKIIFPDISEVPKFLIDTDGLYVDGNCYWITLNPGVPDDYLYLILGVANSKTLQKYHAILFQNKLYSNKYRYITQYVEKYPIPDLHTPEAHAIVKLVKEILHSSASSRQELESQIESQIHGIFNQNRHTNNVGQQKLF